MRFIQFLIAAAILCLSVPAHGQAGVPLPPLPPAFTQQRLLTLTWDTNPEPDVIDYRVYWTTNQAGIDWFNGVSNWVGQTGINNHFTQWSTGGLTTNPFPEFPSITNGFFVTAVNAAGLESDPSLLIRHVNPPKPSRVLLLDVQESTNLVSSTNWSTFYRLRIAIE